MPPKTLTEAPVASLVTSSPVDGRNERSVLRLLRDLIPQQPHPLSWIAAERVATAQAIALCELAHHAGITVDEFVTGLEVIQIEDATRSGSSGLSYWDAHIQRWIIGLDISESEDRRRFTVLHEFKHIIDHGHQQHLYDPRHIQGHVQAEMGADIFAATALMPCEKVEAAICPGTTLESLAAQFGVSCDRAALRLSDLNLLTTITDNNPTLRKEGTS